MFDRTLLRGGGAIAAAVAITAATITPVQAQTSSDAGAAFACDSAFYQVISGQLAELDPATSSYQAVGSGGSEYNALGYRVADGYMYGIRGTSLVRVDANGVVTTTHQLNVSSGSYTGDFGDDGLLHVSRGGRDWRSIDVDTGNVVSRSELSGRYDIADIVNVYGVFYGVSEDGELFRIDPSTGAVRNLGFVPGLPEGEFAFGSAWSSAGGNLYVARNSGQIYQITGYSTDSPQATRVATATRTNSNDGASCSLAQAPDGIADVDGREPETPPSTPEGQAAADRYVAEGSTSYTFPSSGIPDGPSCATGADEDRVERLTFDASTVSTPTVVYSSSDPSLEDFDILSGLWANGDGTLEQTHDCGYDYTALLRAEPLRHYRWEATVGGVDGGINQAGVIINQSSPVTRSGAGIVDLADGGQTLRWGVYDDRGYYEARGWAPIDLGADGAANMEIEVHGNQVRVIVNGATITEFATVDSGGQVGLVTSRAAAFFDDLTLTALVNPQEES